MSVLFRPLTIGLGILLILSGDYRQDNYQTTSQKPAIQTLDIQASDIQAQTNQTRLPRALTVSHIDRKMVVSRNDGLGDLNAQKSRRELKNTRAVGGGSYSWLGVVVLILLVKFTREHN